MTHVVSRNHMIKRIVLAMGFVVLPLAGQQAQLLAANDQRPTEYKSKSYENIDYLGIKPPVVTEKASPIDERPLWKLLSDKKYLQLNKMLERFEKSYPNWQAPADLVAAKIRGEIRQASQNNNAGQVISLAKKYPQLFTCDNIDYMWALGDALHAKRQQEELVHLYQKILHSCAEPENRLITLQRASTQLTYKNGYDLLQIEMQKKHSAFELTTLNDFQYGFYSAWFSKRWDKDSPANMQIPLDYLQQAAREHKDANIAALIGWWALKNKLANISRIWFQHALDWEPDADKAYGLALALRDAKQVEASQEIVQKWKKSDRRIASLDKSYNPSTKNSIFNKAQKSALDYALDKTIRYYNQGNYSASLSHAQQALNKSHGKGDKKLVRALRVFAAWSLYNLGQTVESEQRFEALYRDQARIDSARGLTLSAIANKNFEPIRALGGMDCGPLSFLNSTRIPTDQPTVRSETSGLYYTFYKSWIADELQNKNYRSVELKILRIADQVIKLEDAEMAAAAGWAYLEKGDFGSALFWFERALSWNPTIDNAYGLALVKRALGENEDALRITEKWRNMPDQVLGDQESIQNASKLNLDQLHSELLLEEATHEYEDKNYHKSLALAEQSAAIRSSLAAENLIAWNKFQLGKIQQAADDFARIYRNYSDSQSAEGLAISLSTLGKHDQLKALATELGGPLQQSLRDQQAIKHYYKDEFIPAAQTRITAVPQVKNADTPALSLTPYARHRSGDEGLAQLDMIGLEIGARAFKDQHHFSASLDLINLDSDTAATNALLGSNVNQAFNNFSLTPTEDESLLIEPMFRYRYADKISPYITIGSTPIGGEVSAALVGNIGVDWRSSAGKYHLELFAENKQESILSISGIVDPVTGQSWGRVVETGLRGEMFYQLNPKWALTTGGQYGNLDGRSVADNDHLAAWGSLAYNFKRDGFKYLTIGPSYRFDHYDENRSFFTFGHGGYFSPDSFHKLAAEVNFQTDEGKQYVIKGRGALGYQRSNEDDAYALPLSSGGPLLRAGDNRGVAFDGQLSAVYRLGNWVQIGAFVNITQSPDFDDIGGGLMLRFNAYDRPAVFSLDLPKQTWND